MLRVGILFRGPIRPNIENVLANKRRLLRNFNRANFHIETWLSTWNTWLNNDIRSTIPLTEFDSVICQPEPDNDLATIFFEKEKLNSTQTVSRLWKTMLSSKVALAAMVQSGRYNYIVHARTDGLYDFGNHLSSWFNSDHISTMHVSPRINDFIQIGPANMIRDAWDYDNIDNLKNLIHCVDSPEELIESIAKNRGISFEAKQSEYIWLDKDRNNGDNML